MIELFSLLPEEFRPSEGLETGFYIAITIVFLTGTLFAVGIFGSACWRLRRARKAIQKIESLSRIEDIAALETLLSKHAELHGAWKKFKPRLLKSDGENLRSPVMFSALVRAERQFSRSSIPYLPFVKGSTIAIAGTLCTGLGVTGTFVGLQTGLGGLDTSDLSRLTGEVSELIASLSSAFRTSILGVVASLLVSFVQTLCRERVEASAIRTAAEVDAKFEYVSQESLLVENGLLLREMRTDMEQNRASVQQLAEDIGDRLNDLPNSFEKVIQANLVPTLLGLHGKLDSTGASDGEGGRGANAFVDDLTTRIGESFDSGFEKIGGILESLDKSSQGNSRHLTQIVQAQQSIAGGQQHIREQLVTSTDAVQASLATAADSTKTSETIREGLEGMMALLQQMLREQSQAHLRASHDMAATLAQSQMSPELAESISSQMGIFLDKAVPAAESLASTFGQLSEGTQAVVASTLSLQERSEFEQHLVEAFSNASTEFLAGVRQTGPIASSLGEINQHLAQQAASLAQSLDSWRSCTEIFHNCAKFIQQEIPHLNQQLHATIRQVDSLPGALQGISTETAAWAEKTTLALEGFSSSVSSTLQGSLSQYDSSLSHAVGHLRNAIAELEDMVVTAGSRGSQRPSY